MGFVLILSHQSFCFAHDENIWREMMEERLFLVREAEKKKKAEDFIG
jgi:hypothetical protein